MGPSKVGVNPIGVIAARHSACCVPVAPQYTAVAADNAPIADYGNAVTTMTDSLRALNDTRAQRLNIIYVTCQLSGIRLIRHSTGRYVPPVRGASESSTALQYARTDATIYG